MRVKDSRLYFHREGGEGVELEASDQDLSDTSYQYYGFLSAEGYWIIERFNLTVANVITYRFASGRSGYTTAWAAKAGLSYGLYSALFPSV